MNWTEERGAHVSRPYKVVFCTRGYEAWIFARDRQACLGRYIGTLGEAKAVCEKDADPPNWLDATAAYASKQA